MSMSKQLEAIRQLGWTCEHPEALHTVTALDGKQRRCVWAEGPVVGYAGIVAVYLSADDDCVMLLIPRPRDVTFVEFQRWIRDGDEATVQAAAQKPDPRQKSLF